jgi:hypothetical protein
MSCVPTRMMCFQGFTGILSRIKSFRTVPKSTFGPVVELFWTRQLVELSADLHRKLLDFLPVFLLVKCIVD